MIAYNRQDLDNRDIRSQAAEALAKKVITTEEYQQICQAYPDKLYTPNIYIRIGLFLLTVLAVTCCVGLFLLGGIGELGMSGVLIFFGLAAFAALELFIHIRSLYRAGVDDALLWTGGALIFVGMNWGADYLSPSALSGIVLLLATAGVLRYTNRLMAPVAYGALLSLIFHVTIGMGSTAKALLPFLLMTVSIALYFLFTGLATKERLRQYHSCLTILRVAALLSFYLAGNYYIVRELNTQLSENSGQVALGWLWWLLTAIVPAFYIVKGIQKKDILFLWTGLALVVATIFTVRYYYHVLPAELAMIIGGSILITGAYFLIRYLHTPKYGITSEASDDPHPAANLAVEALILAESFKTVGAQPDSPGPGFGGGSGGGGGAGGKYLLPILLLLLYGGLHAQSVQITVNTLNNRKPVSPYIYGRNNSLSSDPGSPVTAANWQLYKDAGVNFFRENGGNDLTKNNWRLQLSSHPDWYNNVYISDWDFAAQSLQQNIPTAQGMWGFQLIGYAASNTANNFDDWDFNGSQWWSGVEQNLAGGGVANTAGGSQALVNGNPNLYLESWPADSTTGLLPHWFGSGGLGLDSTRIRYWNMDNEVEIWSSTHDDVMPTQPTAEAFLQLYFAVAKKARALYPGIKLTGPVSPNEWQWYNWNNATVTGTDGKQYPWLEYFIKRVSEEEQSSGIRLLDVIDLHFYPSSPTVTDVVQYGRVFFDSTYDFPEANGVKVVNGSWDNSIRIEDVFGRCQDWLNQYMGPGNGVTFGVSETGTQLQNVPNALAVWYASTMGEFMNHGVEFFSPWTWDIGMWETLHLYSKYNKITSVQASSSDSLDVSAYATTNTANDSVTIALVNRSATQTETVTLSFPDFQLSGTPITTLTLSNLPTGTETFVSASNNALQTSAVAPTGNTVQVTMAPMSITSLLLAGTPPILPANLLSFTAEKSNSEVLLNFTTTGDINLASFDIERSGDGVSFTSIGTVPAAAGQNADSVQSAGPAKNSYQFADISPLPALNFYRLNMIDKDGNHSYSNVVVIRYDSTGSLSIFPNPATGTVNVQLQAPPGQLLLQVIDASGRVVRMLSLQSTGGPMSTVVDLSGLATGVYFIRVAGEVQSFLISSTSH